MWQIVLEHWTPPVLSVVLGGIVASIVVPPIQRKFEINKALNSRRLDIAEKLAASFAIYVMQWNRLMQISGHEINRGAISDEERTRKERFVEKRNDCREDLVRLCCIAKIYFSQSASRVIDEYIAWDYSHSASTLSELPPLSQWIEWESKLVDILKSEATSAKVIRE